MKNMGKLLGDQWYQNYVIIISKNFEPLTTSMRVVINVILKNFLFVITIKTFWQPLPHLHGKKMFCFRYEILTPGLDPKSPERDSLPTVLYKKEKLELIWHGNKKGGSRSVLAQFCWVKVYNAFFCASVFSCHNVGYSIGSKFWIFFAKSYTEFWN